MFKWLIEFWKRRKKARSDALESSGWDYAAGLLLKCGADGLEYLEDRLFESKHFGEFNEFDRGIELAVQQFRKIYYYKEY